MKKSVFVPVSGSAILPLSHMLCDLCFMVSQAQILFTEFLVAVFHFSVFVGFAPLINFTCCVHFTTVSYKVVENLDLASCKSINQ